MASEDTRGSTSNETQKGRSLHTSLTTAHRDLHGVKMQCPPHMNGTIPQVVFSSFSAHRPL